MVVIFLVPVLTGVAVARCAPFGFYLTAGLIVLPFAVIPVALGSGITLALVNIFPARRARDILMLMSLLVAASIVLLLRYIQPERLLRVESLPDVTAFFTTLQSPITPLLPSFWAGESLFASLQGGYDLLHGAALWTTALGLTVLLRVANDRWYFSGYSRAQSCALGFSWTLDCERVLAGGVSRWGNQIKNRRRRRKPEGRPETPPGAAVGDGCQPGASARRCCVCCAERISSPCRGSWGSRRRGPRSGGISFWPRARPA